MPLFSLRHQTWQGQVLGPGDLMDGAIRDHRILIEGKYAMKAPDGHHIERRPGSQKWITVPDGSSSKERGGESSGSGGGTAVLTPPDPGGDSTETDASKASKAKKKKRGRWPGGNRDA